MKIKIFQFFKWKNHKNKECGASLVEYGLLIALIALIAVPSIKFCGTQLYGVFETGSLAIGTGKVDICENELC